MFSDAGSSSFDEETLEYGWLVEVSLGHIGAKLSPPQVCAFPFS